MVNYDDFIVKDEHKWYKCTCDGCDKDRGYKRQDKAEGHLCKSCGQKKTPDFSMHANVDPNDTKIVGKQSKIKVRTNCIVCGKDKGYRHRDGITTPCRSCSKKQMHANMPTEQKLEVSQKISAGGVGREPWNKGKEGVYTEEAINKMKEVRQQMIADPNYAIKISAAIQKIPVEDFKEFKTDENQRERSVIRKSGLIKNCLHDADYTCDICGKRGIELQAHHLASFHDNKELRDKPDNLMCLCKPCHKEFHNQYGRGHNTPSQYEAFKSSILKVLSL